MTDAVVGPSVIFDSKSSPLGPLNVVTAKTITFRGVLTSGNVDRGNYVFLKEDLYGRLLCINKEGVYGVFGGCLYKISQPEHPG